MKRIGIVGLVAIDLPAAGGFPAHTIRLCEGGFVRWQGELYQSSDPLFGAIDGVESLSEGVGEEVPVFSLTFLPPGTSRPARLSQPGYQSAPARFWLGEIDLDSGQLVGEPDLQFAGELDQSTLTFGRDVRTLEQTIVSATARLLERNIGNRLNPAWHRSIWPGEGGHDNATGLGQANAWGVERPR